MKAGAAFRRRHWPRRRKPTIVLQQRRLRIRNFMFSPSLQAALRGAGSNPIRVVIHARRFGTSKRDCESNEAN